jgi:transglutaminase-like putative cysteine protease
VRRLQIHHLTRYRYAETVTLLPHTLYLRPRDGHDVRVQSSRLDISPAFDIRWKRDIFDNSVAVVAFRQPAAELTISSEVVVEHYEEQPLEFVLEDSARRFPFNYEASDHIDLAPYQRPLFPDEQDRVKDWIAGIFAPGSEEETIELLTRINREIAGTLKYQPREMPGVQSPATTLDSGRGSCRDFATLFIEVCRQLGLAARFISGYLLNESVPQDMTATHAWLEVFLPGSGWRGFDPTSGELVGGDHIAVAVHRHPEAVPPVSGSFSGSGNAKPQLSVEVRVSNIPD